MGNCVNAKGDDGQKQMLNMIPEKDLKLLLLGAGESGKSKKKKKKKKNLNLNS